MSDPITSGDRVRALADVWDAKARAFREYDAQDPKASVLERCAADLREMASSTAGDLIAFVDALERSAAADPRVAAEAARFAAVMLERIDNARAVLAKARGEVSHG